MKVGILTSTLDPHCGMGNFSLNMAIHLSKLVQVSVVVSEEYEQDALQAKKLLSRRHAATIFNTIDDAHKVAKYTGDCDLIHCIDENYILVTTLAARLQNKQYILHSIGTYSILPLHKSLVKHLYKRCFKGAKKLYA